VVWGGRGSGGFNTIVKKKGGTLGEATGKGDTKGHLRISPRKKKKKVDGKDLGGTRFEEGAGKARKKRGLIKNPKIGSSQTILKTSRKGKELRKKGEGAGSSGQCDPIKKLSNKTISRKTKILLEEGQRGGHLVSFCCTKNIRGGGLVRGKEEKRGQWMRHFGKKTKRERRGRPGVETTSHLRGR